jgi:hypothetical protein
MSPDFTGSDWKNIDVPIEGKMPPWFADGEIANAVRKMIDHDRQVGEAVNQRHTVIPGPLNARACARDPRGGEHD